MSSSARSEPVFSGGGRERTLIVRRSPRARRLSLRIDPRDGSVRLTLPRRAILSAAYAWVEQKRGWIEAALARMPPTEPIAPGGSLLFDGERLTIAWDAAESRAVRIDGGRLIVGGPAELVGTRIRRWLRGEAAARLDAETRAVALRAGVSIGRVRVGDQRSRWGSCSATGDIAYSWRLILAPPAVREAIVVHEVAHRLHMHHGPVFHAAVARLLGREPVAERAWLRTHGARLHAIGRED